MTAVATRARLVERLAQELAGPGYWLQPAHARTTLHRYAETVVVFLVRERLLAPALGLLPEPEAVALEPTRAVMEAHQ